MHYFIYIKHSAIQQLNNRQRPIATRTWLRIDKHVFNIYN